MKKCTSFILSLVLLLTMFPLTGLMTVNAATVKFTEVEPNSKAATAEPIKNNYEVTAVLTNGDTDFFSFKVAESSTVTFTGKSDDLNLYVGLLNSSVSVMTVTFPRDGAFVLKSTVGAGDYYAYFSRMGDGTNDIHYSFLLEITPHVHEYDNTCDGYCNTCGASRTPPHSFADKEDTQCDVCGKTCTHHFTNSCDNECNRCYGKFPGGHDYAAATCTDPKICKVCGNRSGSALGHTYSKSCDVDCNVCGAIRTVPHNYGVSVITKEATCHSTGIKTFTCRLCDAPKQETIPKLKHQYTNSCDATCNLCGDKRDAGHTYSNACDIACDKCFATRSGGHKYGTVLKKGTPTADGYTLKRCSVCQKEHSKKTLYKASKITLSKTEYTYNGKAQKPTVTVKNSKGGTIDASNYTVTYAGGRTNAGTYKVTVKMKGKYSGTKTLTFKIKPKKTTGVKVTASKTAFTYNGKAQAPTVTVKDVQGTKLKKGTDYTVTLPTARKNAGTYKVKITFKGNYSGTKTVTYTIKPPATKFAKVTPAKKSLKVTVAKKTSQVSGYQIQYATTPTFKTCKTKTLSGYKKTAVTLSGLTAKKTYYLRVRTYKTVNGEKIYSSWSGYKTVKTK